MKSQERACVLADGIRVSVRSLGVLGYCVAKADRELTGEELQQAYAEAVPAELLDVTAIRSEHHINATHADVKG